MRNRRSKYTPYEQERLANHPPHPPRKKKKSIWAWVVGLMGGIVALNIVIVALFAVRAFRSAPVQSPFTDLAVEADTTDTDVAIAPTATPLPEIIEITKEPISQLNFLRPKGVKYFLMTGVDARPDQVGQPVRTDMMMAVRVDFDNATVRMLSFPRDLWVAMPSQLVAQGKTEGRINEAYFFGDLYDTAGGGSQAAMDVVRLNFGIPIEQFGMVNFQGVVDVVDALGGIEVDVPKAIYDARFPTENYGYMTFAVDPGLQTMDGITALRYARTRHQDSDLQRILRQQAVILGIRDAALQIDLVTKVPDLWIAISANYDTDVALNEVIRYGLVAQQIPRDQIETFAIDGTMLSDYRTPAGASVFLMDRSKVAVIVEEFMAD